MFFGSSEKENLRKSLKSKVSSRKVSTWHLKNKAFVEGFTFNRSISSIIKSNEGRDTFILVAIK
jgi:hypothetical protein